MAEYVVTDKATINGVAIKITRQDGSFIEPAYEAHSLDKVNEIVNETLKLISDGSRIEVTIY